MVVAHFRAFKYFIFVVADTNIKAPVKRKLDTSDTTKIQKKARSKIARKRNENTTLIENLATEAVSSSHTKVEFCQKEYEERQVVEEEDEEQEEVEEQGKTNKVREEEEERHDDRQLQQHRQTTSKRVNSCLLVKFKILLL